MVLGSTLTERPSRSRRFWAGLAVQSPILIIGGPFMLSFSFQDPTIGL